jgi:hypothetical protein
MQPIPTAMHLAGTPSDQSPAILATGLSEIRFAFLSLSERDPAGRDAAYLEWHSLDHRPEQYRLAQLRNTLRLVSTPACRAARAANVAPYDAVDHVMTYLFTGSDVMPVFTELGAVLNQTGRMPHRLPSVGFRTAETAGKIAAPRAVAGADVIPDRPALGVWLMIERGHASPAALVDLPGIAGVWWYHGLDEHAGLQITYCYLDVDPVDCATLLADAMKQRWASGEVQGLLAAPFHTVVPYEWGRHLP